MPKSVRKTGRCPNCPAKVLLQADGRLSEHFSSSSRKFLCMGSHRQPVNNPALVVDTTDYSDLTDVAAGVVAGAYKVAGVGLTTRIAWLDKLALCAEDTATSQSLALAAS